MNLRDMRKILALMTAAALALVAAPGSAQVPPARGPTDGYLFAAGTTNLTNGVFFPGTATCDADGCQTAGPPLQVAEGTDITFTNLDTAAVTNGHRIVSFDRKKSKKKNKKGRPLFFSDMSNGPEQVTVETSKVKPGIYYYYCTTHFGMFGGIEIYEP